MAKGNPNPKTENLTSIGDFPREKQLEITSKGGKASAEARRKRKEMKEQLETLLTLPVASPKTKQQLKALGITEDDMNNQMQMLVAMFKKACSGAKGDVQAFLAIRDLIGEKPTEKVQVETVNADKLDSILRQLEED